MPYSTPNSDHPSAAARAVQRLRIQTISRALLGGTPSVSVTLPPGEFVSLMDLPVVRLTGRAVIVTGAGARQAGFVAQETYCIQSLI